jgi:hypothetical protein
MQNENKKDKGKIPRTSVENVMKLGFVLEQIYFVHYNYRFIETLLYVQYVIYFNYPKLAYSIASYSKV